VVLVYLIDQIFRQAEGFILERSSIGVGKRGGCARPFAGSQADSAAERKCDTVSAGTRFISRSGSTVQRACCLKNFSLAQTM
jgi:hypothetical protein